MKKQLDTSTVQNELSGASLFFTRPASPPAKPSVVAPQPVGKQPTTERSNARTVERPNGKRIITRNSFEIYEDQMEALRERSYQERRQGKPGSMSAMVRNAIDAFLKQSSKTTNS
jgi:hypothetical protein